MVKVEIAVEVEALSWRRAARGVAERLLGEVVVVDLLLDAFVDWKNVALDELDRARARANLHVQLVLELRALQILLRVRQRGAHIVVFQNVILKSSSEIVVLKRRKTSISVFRSGRWAILFFK